MPFSSLVILGVFGREDPISIALSFFVSNGPLADTTMDGVGERSIAHLTLDAQVSTIGRSLKHGVSTRRSLSGYAEEDSGLDKPGGWLVGLRTYCG